MGFLRRLSRELEEEENRVRDDGPTDDAGGEEGQERVVVAGTCQPRQARTFAP